MDSVVVHPRVMRRHPNLSERDVLAAWKNAVDSTPRIGSDPLQYIVLGFDAKGRLVEMVAIRLGVRQWLVFHAQTPPSDATYREFGFERR